MKKRVFALLICLSMVVAFIPQVSAARFADVHNDDTALDIAVLRLMGVISGDPDGNYRPNDSLTRAEFCKMAVMLMGKESEISRFRSRTIFSDVRATHWAAPYINYAASGTGIETSVSVSTSSEDGTVSTNRYSTGIDGAIIHGQPDGTFAPERHITYAEAVTILMRVIGYGDSKVDMIWPYGYLSLAKDKELTKGISLNANGAISRAQAAKLFVNALTTEAGGIGQEYITTLGLVSGEVTVLSVDLNTGKMITTEPTTEGSSSQYQSTHEYSTSTDDSGSVQIQSRSESQYTSSYSSGSKTEYKIEQLMDLSEFIGLKGRVVTKNGKVLTFLPSRSIAGGTVSDAAIIVSANGSTTGFDALTGGATNYTVYRNGVRASASALKKGDVVTYNASNNTIQACDTRVAVYYENCEPSPAAPTSITVLGGTVFKVMTTAQGSLAQLKPGKNMVIQLTADGRVAGAVDSGNANGMNGNAFAYVDSKGKVSLICANTLVELEGSYSAYAGQAVRISQSGKTVNLSKQSSSNTGVLDLTAKTLGTRKLADGVLVFSGGELTSLEALGVSRVEQSGITYARTNAAGEVDLIVIADNSDVYYGRAIVRAEYDEDTHEVTDRFIRIDGNGHNTKEIASGNNVRTGDFVAAQLNSAGTMFTSFSTLTKLASVPASAWIGDTAVNHGGQTYTVDPDTVICYNRDAGAWFADLDAAKAYGGTMDLYVKDGVVRAIEVRA